MHNNTIFKNFLIVSLASSLILGCVSTAHRESTGQYIDNSAITARVKAKLLADEKVSGTAIKVTSYKGVVQLSGFVDSYDQERHAVQLTKRVPGVVSIQDSLVVKSRVGR